MAAPKPRAPPGVAVLSPSVGMVVDMRFVNAASPETVAFRGSEREALVEHVSSKPLRSTTLTGFRPMKETIDAPSGQQLTAARGIGAADRSIPGDGG